MENFVASYDLNMYGFISVTNYKYVILKNEHRQNPMDNKAPDGTMRTIFMNLQKLHTEMLLNPFYEQTFPVDSGRMNLQMLHEDPDDDLQMSDSNSKEFNVKKNNQECEQRFTLKVDELINYYDI